MEKKEKNAAGPSEFESLKDSLNHKDGLERRKARLVLEKAGKLAVPFLIEALSAQKECARWEAAKALSVLQDPSAAPALVNALKDESFEVQWLAAEALVVLKEIVLLPLLKALAEEADSVELRQGAHHVLFALERDNLLGAPSLEVLEALRSIDPDLSVTVASKKALEILAKK